MDRETFDYLFPNLVMDLFPIDSGNSAQLQRNDPSLRLSEKELHELLLYLADNVRYTEIAKAATHPNLPETWVRDILRQAKYGTAPQSFDAYTYLVCTLPNPSLSPELLQEATDQFLTLTAHGMIPLEMLFTAILINPNTASRTANMIAEETIHHSWVAWKMPTDESRYEADKLMDGIARNTHLTEANVNAYTAWLLNRARINNPDRRKAYKNHLKVIASTHYDKLTPESEAGIIGNALLV